MSDLRPRLDVRSAPVMRQLVIRRTVKASPERIFDAFTDADQLTKWWWPAGFSCPSADADLRVGGKYRLTMEWPEWIPIDARFSHALEGEYFEISRPHRLVMSGRAVNDEQGELFATLIDLTFVECQEGTEVTVRQSYFDPLPPASAFAGAEQGWVQQFDKLDQVVAT